MPELIRQLCAEHSYDFDKAFEIAHKVFNYTNHTIMAEALEKWDCRLVEKVVPEVYTYILMINERFIKDMYALKKDREYISKLSPVGDGMVKMAFMAIYVSSYINGVAAIHTEILKRTLLRIGMSFILRDFRTRPMVSHKDVGSHFATLSFPHLSQSFLAMRTG